MITSAASTLLNSGVSSFIIVDTYEIGTYTVDSETWVVKRGTMEGREGLDAKTLDLTISTGGSSGPGSALHADALAGDLAGVDFVYTRTYVGGGDVVRFTGTVQRVEVGSATVRLVAASCTVNLDAIQLPSHVILPGEFPEIPPPENYNVR